MSRFAERSLERAEQVVYLGVGLLLLASALLVLANAAYHLVTDIDEGVREIVRELRRGDELRETYVIFTSDNGFFHGEHRIRAGKFDVYEPSIRIPLLLRGPGVPRGATVNELTASLPCASFTA